MPRIAPFATRMYAVRSPAVSPPAAATTAMRTLFTMITGLSLSRRFSGISVPGRRAISWSRIVAGRAPIARSGDKRPATNVTSAGPNSRTAEASTNRMLARTVAGTSSTTKRLSRFALVGASLYTSACVAATRSFSSVVTTSAGKSRCAIARSLVAAR